MDPIAHTLFGATLAETGLKNRSRYATATLIIGANLPDVDALITVLGADTALLHRRGWTHGILAMLILPLLLSLGIWAWQRYKSKIPQHGPALNMPWILALSYLATWSHPLLDWTNTYGVRFLMPFDGRWFYGDTLFIIDPWFWLMTAAAVMLVRSNSKRALTQWILLGILSSMLILSVPIITFGVKAVWLTGLTLIILLRWLKPDPARLQPIARVCLSMLLVYIGITHFMARSAEARLFTEANGILEVQSNPIPGIPFQHRLIEVYPTHYRVIPAEGDPFEVKREPLNDIVRKALNSEKIEGFRNWMRFPYWELEQKDNHAIVTFRDLRYVDPGQPGRGIGMVQVEVPL